MSKRRSRNAARLSGSSSRPPTAAEQRRSSAQLQAERQRLGIGGPEDQKAKASPKSRKKASPDRAAGNQQTSKISKSSGSADSKRTRERRNISDATDARVGGPATVPHGATDWKTAVLKVLATGEWLTASEIADRIYSTRLSEELARRGLISGNPSEAIRRAIGQANSEGHTVARRRDTEDGAIRFALREPQPTTDIERHEENHHSRTAVAPHSAPRSLNLLDAAELVLRNHAGAKPLTIRGLVLLAVEHGYWATEGKTPANSLSAQVGIEIKKRQLSGQPQRFTRPWRGYVGLASWDSPSSDHKMNERTDERTDSVEPVQAAINQLIEEMQDDEATDAGADTKVHLHYTQAVEHLEEFLCQMDPDPFELCLRAYLTAIGTNDLRLAHKTRTLDVSVRGTLIVEGLFQIPITVYVYRCPDYAVTASDIAHRRSDMGAYDLALVISLGGFEPDALHEATRSNASPLAVLDGNDFAEALVERRIGVDVAHTETFIVGPFFGS